MESIILVQRNNNGEYTTSAEKQQWRVYSSAEKQQWRV